MLKKKLIVPFVLKKAKERRRGVYFRTGFTLVELVVVVIILSTLLALASAMYSNIHEKSRAAEAKTILAHIRAAEELYRLEDIVYNSYTGNITYLAVEVPSNCQSTHYFNYSLTSADNDHFTAKADRCIAGGKAPQAKSTYAFTINETGTLTKPANF
ncbi:MAG: type IV pilin protein [Candidatus Omnitrophota bacterium]